MTSAPASRKARQAAGWSLLYELAYAQRVAVYDRRRWQDVRRFVLARDRFRCQVDGCHAPTNLVDHMRPLARGGAPYDVANLRACCRHHNGALSVELAGAGWPSLGAWRAMEVAPRRRGVERRGAIRLG